MTTKEKRIVKTKVKQRARRKAISKVVRFSRVLAIKGSVTSEQIKAGNIYLAEKAARARRVKKKYDKARLSTS